MKYPLFCDDKDTEEDVRIFITQTVDNSHEEQIQEGLLKALETERKTTLPMPLEWMKLFALFLSVVGIVGIFGALGNGTSLSQAYQNAPIIFYMLPFTVAGYIGLTMYQKRLKSQVENSEEVEQLRKQLEQIKSESTEQLGIPGNALDMDVIAFTFKRKGEEYKLVNTGLIQAFNLQKFMYIDGSDLCIADFEQVHSIPLESIKNIMKVDKKMAIYGWNKDDIDPTDGEFKQYNIRVNSMGMILVKPYYIVSIEAQGNEYELYLANYEIERFSKLVGLPYTEAE